MKKVWVAVLFLLVVPAWASADQLQFTFNSTAFAQLGLRGFDASSGALLLGGFSYDWMPNTTVVFGDFFIQIGSERFTAPARFSLEPRDFPIFNSPPWFVVMSATFPVAMVSAVWRMNITNVAAQTLFGCN